MINNNDYVPFIARFKLQRDQKKTKEFKITVLVPNSLITKGLNLEVLTQNLGREVLERILEKNPDDFRHKNELLNPITLNAYEPRYKQIGFTYDAMNIEKSHPIAGTITDVSLYQLGGVGSEFIESDHENSWLPLIPLLSSVWPVFTAASGGKNLEEIEYERSKNGPMVFNGLLRAFAEELRLMSFNDGIDGKHYLNLADSLDVAHGIGEQIRQAGRQQEKYVDIAAKNIFEQVKKNETITVPLGYHRGGVYVPLFLIFFLEGNKVCLKVVSLDPAIEKRSRPYYLYVFNTNHEGVLIKQIQQILYLLEKFQQTPKKAMWDTPSVGANQIARFEKLTIMATGGEDPLNQAEAESECLAWLLDGLKNKTKAAMYEDPNRLTDVNKKLSSLSPRHNFDPFREEFGEATPLDNIPLLVLGLKDSGIEGNSQKLEKIIKQLEDIKVIIDKDIVVRRQRMGEGKTELVSDSRDIVEIIHELIRKNGAFPLPLPAGLKQSFKTGRDKLSLLFTWFRTQAAGITNEHLLTIETQLVISVAKLFQKNLVSKNLTLTPEQIDSGFNVLQKIIQRLAHKYQKEFGHTRALESIWNSTGVSGDVLSDIRDKIQKHKEACECDHYQKLKNITFRSKPWDVAVNVKETVLPPQGSTKLQGLKIQDLIMLEMAFHKKNNYQECQDLIETLIFGDAKKKINGCTIYYEQKEYQTLENAAIDLLSRLPGPENHFWINLPSTRIDYWAEKIVMLTQLLWEAHLKQGHKYSWPESVFALMNAKAAFYTLIEKKGSVAKQNILEKFQALTPEKQAILIQEVTGDGNCFVLKTFLTIKKPDIQLFAPEEIVYFTKFCKALDVSKEDSISSLFLNFTWDYQQPLFLLCNHPFFRFGREEGIESKVEALIAYFDKIRKNAVKYFRKPLTLDSYRDLMKPQESGDLDFLMCAAEILRASNPKINPTTVVKDLWTSNWKPSSSNQLPHICMLLRRQSMFIQIILHPESSIYKGFSKTGLLGLQERAAFGMEKMNQVKSDVDDFKTSLKMMGELQSQELTQKIFEMGHLDLELGQDAEIDTFPIINITDNGGYSIGYYPTGVKLHDFRNPFHDELLFGQDVKVPQSFITNRVGASDWFLSSNDKTIKLREQEKETVQPTTEVTIVREESGSDASSNLSAEVNARLRGLVVESADSLIPSPNTFYNIFAFIFDYKHLLETEVVQKILENALFKTGTIRTALKSNPLYFKNSDFAAKMIMLIKSSLEMDRTRTATFLMHINQVLKSYIKHMDPPIAQLDRVSQSLPDFSLVIPLSKGGVTGEAYIRTLLSNPVTDQALKKYVFTHYLYFLHSLSILSKDQYRMIFLGHALIKNCGSESGHPVLQKYVIDWVEKTMIPNFLEISEKERCEVLTSIATGSEFNAGANIALWTKEGASTFCSPTGVIIDLKQGMVKIPGQKALGYQTQLPDPLLKYLEIFGQNTYNAFSVPPPEGKQDWKCYSFMKNNKSFQIEYHPQSRNINLYQTMTVGKKECTYQYQNIESSSAGGAQLLVRYGIWVNIRNKNDALICLASPFDAKPNDLLKVTLDWRGNIIECLTSDSDYVVNDADNDLLKILKFVDPSDLVIIQPRSKKYKCIIRIISKGISLAQNWDEKKEAWIGLNDLEGYNVIMNPNSLKRIAQIFGPDFHSYMLPLEQTDPVSGVQKNKYLMVGVGLEKPMEQKDYKDFQEEIEVETSLAANSAIPILSVEEETGRGDGHDGRLITSSTGFFYLSYLSFFNEDYERAVKYLAKSLESPFVAKELKIFELVINYIRNHADETSRGLAFRLKAELIIRRIRRDQLGLKEFKPTEWKDYLEKIRSLLELYRKYQFKKNIDRLSSSVKLNDSEIGEYKKLINESFDFLIEFKPNNILPEVTPALPMVTTSIDTDSLGYFARHLAYHMHEKQEDLSLLPVRLDMKAILENFWGYADQIIRQKLNPNDPIVMALDGIILKDLSKEDAKQVHIARQFLVMLARFNQSEAIIKNVGERLALEGAVEPEQVKTITAVIDNLKDAREKLSVPLVPPILWKEATTVVQSMTSQLTTTRLALYAAWKWILEQRHQTKFAPMGEVIEKVKEALKAIHFISEQFVIIDNLMKGKPSEKKVENDKYSTTLNKIISSLIDPRSPFTIEERVYWAGLVQTIQNDSTIKMTPDEKKPLELYLKGFYDKNISTQAVRYETETIKEITDLLATLKVQRKPRQLLPELLQLTYDNKSFLLNREKEYLEIYVNCFASSSWKPDAETIKNDLERLNDWKEAFVWNYEQIAKSTDANFLDKLADNYSTEKFRLDYKWVGNFFFGKIEEHQSTQDISSKMTIRWYLSVAANCRKIQLKLGNHDIKYPDILKLSENPSAFFKMLDQFEYECAQAALMHQITLVGSRVKSNYSNSSSDMEKAENAKICLAIDERIKLKQTDQRLNLLKKDTIESDCGVLQASGLQKIRNFIQLRQSTLSAKIVHEQKEIIKSLHDNRLFINRSTVLGSRLNGLLIENSAISTAEILDVTLDLYKNNELWSQSKLSPEKKDTLENIERHLTYFLYMATELQQLKKTKSILSSMEDLLGKKLKVNPDNALNWEDQSVILMRLLQGAGKSRYIDAGFLQVLPTYSRRHLVAEYRSEMIARSFQPETVEKLIDNPNNLILLRPGAGKSKWIMPEIAELLARVKNKFPVILVTEELLDINRTDLDKSTLELFKQAGHIFDYTRKTRKDIAYLADEYKRLLLVQKNYGYVITTIGRLAALEDEVVVTGLELEKQYNNFVKSVSDNHFDLTNINSRNEAIQTLLALVQIQKQLHWLNKIRDLFRAPADVQTKEVAFVADEVDDIFSIDRDYNYSITDSEKGTVRPLNPDLCRTMQQIMMTIMTSKEQRLKDLRDKLISNQQSTLNAQFSENGETKPVIELYLRELAHAIFQEPIAFDLPPEDWNWMKSLGSVQEFIGFVTGKKQDIHVGFRKEIRNKIISLVENYSKNPEFFKDLNTESLKWLESSKNNPKSIDEALTPVEIKEKAIQSSPLKYIGALKHFLSITLPSALLQDANTDYGLSEDGVTVVPKKEGQDLPNVRFSDEYECIAFHDLFSISKCVSFAYFKEQWRKKEYEIRTQSARKWQAWFEEIQNTLVPVKNMPQPLRVSELSAKNRLKQIYKHFSNPGKSWLQRLDLLHSVILPNCLKDIAQVKCNAQDPLHQVAIAGASGTMNEYALPDAFVRDKSVNSREVMADTLMKLATMNEDGLNGAVKEISLPIPQICRMAREYKFVIDQTAVTEGFTTREVVQKIRADLELNRERRQIMFVGLIKVGENKFIRRQMMWDPDETEPKLFDRSKLDNSISFFYYGPADVRGTDFPMPSGTGAFITGANTVDEQFIQGIWRARRLGQGQNVDIYVPQAVARATRQSLKIVGDKLKIGDWFNEIKRRTLDKKAGQNYKSLTKKIQNIIPQEIKFHLFRTYVKDEIAYWHRGGNEINILSDIALDASLFQTIKRYFVEYKDVNFVGEFEPIQQLDTLQVLGMQTQKQIHSATQLNEDLKEIPKAVSASLAILYKKALPPNLLFAASHGMQQTTIGRLRNILNAFRPIHSKIETYHVSIVENWNKHRDNLKPKISTGLDAGNGSQEMVQEQAQQQQQQQQQVTDIGVKSVQKPPRKESERAKWVNWVSDQFGMYKPVEQIKQLLLGPMIDGKVFIPMPENCGFLESIKMSVNYKRMFDQMKHHRGDLMGRLAVVNGFNNKQIYVLIDNLDLELGFRPNIGLNNSLGIYGIPMNVQMNELPYTFLEGIKSIRDDFWGVLVQVKLLSGCVLFKTDLEQQAISVWIKNNPKKAELKAFLCKIHGVDAVTQIPNWDLSILKDLLA